MWSKKTIFKSNLENRLFSLNHLNIFNNKRFHVVCDTDSSEFSEYNEKIKFRGGV